MLKSIDTLVAFALIMTVVSLLITILVQMTSAALNLRGKHLANALAQTLDTVVPGTTATVSNKAAALAKHILSLPHLSDNPKVGIDGNPKTSAVRASEIYGTLLQIAKSETNPDLRMQAVKVLRDAGVPAEVLASAEVAKSAWSELRKQIADGGTTGPLASLMGKVDEIESYVSHVVSQRLEDSEAAWKRFEFWFESSQDRAQQWFAANTRVLTIIFSGVAALTLQLDTIEIYRHVSSDSNLRASLVEQAGAITTVAQRALEPATDVLRTAWCAWSSQANDEKTEVGKLVASLGKEAKAKILAEAVSDTDFRGTFVLRLRQAMAGAPPEKASQVEDSFVADLENEGKKQLAEKSADFRLAKSMLDNSGFELAPKGWWRWKDERMHGYFAHALGMMMTMGLLTLGAPFWFNTLKGLTNLRSVVAKDISHEEQTKGSSASYAVHSSPPALQPS